MNFAAGLKLNSRYTLLNELGEGGVGVVWEAEDEVLGRHVAIKVPLERHLRSDPALVQMFPEETRAASRLFNHPHIVAVLDFFQHPGKAIELPCVVMELLKGMDGHELARSHLSKLANGTTKTLIAVYVALCVAKAIQYAHENGVIHRDIKPGNVLISSGGAVKLVDFGFAKFTDEATRAFTLKNGGTFLYFAPEQAAGQPGSRQTDAYQLGCILYELFEGKAPFEELPNFAARMHAKSTQPTPTLSANVGLDDEDLNAIASVCSGLLEANPNKRLSLVRVVDILSGVIHNQGIGMTFPDALIDQKCIDSVRKITTIDLSLFGALGGEGVNPFRGMYYPDADEALTETLALFIAGFGECFYLEREPR